MIEEAIQTARENRENIDRVITEMQREGQEVPEDLKKSAEVLRDFEKLDEQKQIANAEGVIRTAKSHVDAAIAQLEASGRAVPPGLSAVKSSLGGQTVSSVQDISNALNVAQNAETAANSASTQNLLETAGDLLVGAVALGSAGIAAGAQMFGGLVDPKTLAGLKGMFADSDAGLKVVNSSAGKSLSGLASNIANIVPVIDKSPEIGMS